MGLFRKRTETGDLDAAAQRLAEIEATTEDLKQRVKRLEAESRVYLLHQRRRLRERGISC